MVVFVVVTPNAKWLKYQHAKQLQTPGLNSKMKKAEILELLKIPPSQEDQEEEVKELADLKLPQQENRNWSYEVKIVHDESIARSKDAGKTHWDEKGHHHKLSSKTNGTGVMVSAFCSPHFGWLAYTDEAWAKILETHPEWANDEEKHRHAYQIFEFGKQNEGIGRQRTLFNKLIGQSIS
jgi:hypothetical protein